MKLPEPYTPAQRAANKMARTLPGDDLTPFIDALQTYGIACARAALEEAAKVCESQKYMTLEPIRMYTADETWQTVRDSMRLLTKFIRSIKIEEKG